MGFLKRTNKKFDYKPRFYKGEGNPYEIGHKFDEFRTTVGKSKGIKSTFKNAIEDLKNPELQDRNVTLTTAVIIGVLFLIFLFFIEFDLSIFVV
ncbi:hypothetical protein GCM10011416_17680 [Polaribacter pacificus]|uniref:Riboflavin synthase subunit beta n=1 Tax=Polaribacter pacificus TaxID=1775173 RepID=A0A917HZ81_9FLAO|nr:riboflavin synthase subunit beta [Polaribacter pacificus]GGG99740.1 hypothetical protein GCM10011416_17680 [Polaribacter pacificus]